MCCIIMRGSRTKDMVHKNRRLFWHEIVYRRQLLIVLAIMGLGQDEAMEEWWVTNSGACQP